MTKHDVLQAELRPGENLLWSEEADAFAYVTIESAFPVAFGALWVLAVALNFSQSENMPYAVFTLFLLVGVFIAGLGLWHLLKACFTFYAITSRRLLITRCYPWNTEVESYHNADIDFLRKVRKRRGNGNIIFTTVPQTGRKGRTYYRDVGFFGIDDVDAVEKLIQDTFRAPTKPISA